MSEKIKCVNCQCMFEPQSRNELRNSEHEYTADCCEALKAEVERLTKRVAELESGRVRVSPLPDALIELSGAAELEQFGGLVFHQPQATVGPLMSEHCHYWGCPAVTTPGAACDCGAGKEGGA